VGITTEKRGSCIDGSIVTYFPGLEALERAGFCHRMISPAASRSKRTGSAAHREMAKSPLGQVRE